MHSFQNKEHNVLWLPSYRGLGTGLVKGPYSVAKLFHGPASHEEKNMVNFPSHEYMPEREVC